jgi:hypothetical protein
VGIGDLFLENSTESCFNSLYFCIKRDFLTLILLFSMALIFGTSDRQRSAEISRAVKAGKLRKLASKLYTDDLKTAPATIIQRNRLLIAAYFYPGAVLSHRSALEGGGVSPAGKLHLSVARKGVPPRKLPGLEIRAWQGPRAQGTDIRTPLDDGLEIFTASQQRAVLENFQIARARANDEAKTLSANALEHWFDRQLRIFGADWLAQIEVKVESLAADLGWQRELECFQQFVAALRGKPSTHQLRSDLVKSRAHGKPYDPERISLFTELHARLAQEHFPEQPAPVDKEHRNRAFWEAYFSNFIEGTKFSVEEAQELVNETDGAANLEQNRPNDAHDVKETYRLIVDPNISAEVAKSQDDYMHLIIRRHARMMATRHDVQPSVFKSQNNEVGSRVFVKPELVRETLARGWLASQELKSAAAKAFFMLFVVAEVHPFKDGNGRISRLGMNAILENAGQMRLIIPTSLRNDYFSVLEALTLSGNSNSFVTFAHKLMDLNSRMPFSSFDESYAYFKKTGALDEPQSSNYSLPNFVQ